MSGMLLPSSTPTAPWLLAGALASTEGVHETFAWAPAAEPPSVLLTAAGLGLLSIGALLIALRRRTASSRGDLASYRALFENNPTPMMVYLRDGGRFVAVNRSAEEHYGYSRAEFLAMTVNDLCLVPSSLASEKGAEPDRPRVSLFRTKSGAVAHVDLIAKSQSFGGSDAVLLVATEALRQLMAEARSEELFENAIEGICETAADGRFLKANPAFARMLGFGSPQELLESDPSSTPGLYVQAGRRNEFFALLGASDFLKDFESEVRRRDGSTIWICENVQVVRNAEGHILRIHSFVSDVTARRRATEALRLSERRLARIVQQADCLLWQAQVAERAGFFEWRYHVPPSGLHNRLCGAGAPAESARLWTPERVPDFAALEQRAVDALRSGASEYQQEFQARCEGGRVWLSEKVEITRLSPSEWLLVGVAIDVTSRRQAEESLRASEARYRQFVEHTPIAIVELDLSSFDTWVRRLREEGVRDCGAHLDAHPAECERLLAGLRIGDMNHAALRLFGVRSLEDFIRAADFRGSEEFRRICRSIVLALWEGRIEAEGKTAVRTAHGATVAAMYHLWLPVLDGKPCADGAQLAFVDLTEINRAEEALAAERERLGVMLSAMEEAVFSTDTRGVVQYINSAAEKMTGWPFEESVGRTLSEVCVLLHARLGTPVVLHPEGETRKALVSDLPTQTTLRTREGREILVEGRLAALHGKDAAFLGEVLVLRDMTERAKLEAEQLRSSKLESLGILAGGIAHDFNNLLTVVMGNLTLAMLDTQVMSAAGRWLKESEKGVLRARDLTQQLLTFAKGGDPVRASVSLQDIVRETAEFALHGSKVLCRFDFSPGLWPADVDKAQIGQVVQNIVINAVQAMPGGGVLKLSLANEAVGETATLSLAPGRYLRLSISDTGTGISPEHLTRIFDPYFTTKPQGSGLGLATVYSIVKRHQGHVDVYSKPGEGTTFHIWLPAAKHRARIERISSRTGPARNGRILFMDDEEPIRRLGEALLRSLGYEACVVGDGAQALEEYRRASVAGVPYDIVMLDLTVPGGMGGLETLECLKALDPEVKAVVTSGYSSDPVLGNYREHGFVGVVPKPYRISDLAKTIQNVLSGEY